MKSRRQNERGRDGVYSKCACVCKGEGKKEDGGREIGHEVRVY